MAQLEKILPAYVAHFQANPGSLLTRFCGLYSVETYEREGDLLPLDAAAARLLGKDKTRTYFVVMSNVLYSPVHLHERYDLKGSTQGRLTKEPSEFRKSELVMKVGGSQIF